MKREWDRETGARADGDDLAATFAAFVRDASNGSLDNIEGERSKGITTGAPTSRERGPKKAQKRANQASLKSSMDVSVEN